MNEKLNQGIKSCTVKTDKFFQDIYSVTDKDYSLISEAQTYSLLAGGKRVRPFIVNEVCRMFGGNQEHALTLGAALEMVASGSRKGASSYRNT